MKYLIDTDICIYLIKRQIPSVAHRLTQQATTDILLSSITVAELEYGMQKSATPKKNRETLMGFLAPFTIQSFDPQACEKYGQVRAQLEKKGKLIGPLDMLIAAHALSLEAILVTNNTKEFSRVPGLTVENWVTSP